jgi:hypothetical protein
VTDLVQNNSNDPYGAANLINDTSIQVLPQIKQIKDYLLPKVEETIRNVDQQQNRGVDNYR